MRWRSVISRPRAAHSRPEDRVREVETLAAATDGLLFGGAAVLAAGVVLTFVLPAGGEGDGARVSAGL